MSQMTYMNVANEYLAQASSMSNQELATLIGNESLRGIIVAKNYNSEVSNNLDRMNEKLENPKFCYESTRNVRMKDKLRAKLNSKKK